MTNLSPMSGRADVVGGSPQVACDPAPGYSVGPVSIQEQYPPSSDDWPLQSYLELAALTGATPSARLHARLVLDEWGMGELAPTVELVASELVTNAVAASEELTGGRHNRRRTIGNPVVRLWLRSDKQRVLVLVWDGDHRMPVRQEADLDDEHGRGLMLVEAVSEGFGAYRAGQRNGKVVWAAFGSL